MWVETMSSDSPRRRGHVGIWLALALLVVWSAEFAIVSTSHSPEGGWFGPLFASLTFVTLVACAVAIGRWIARLR